MDSGKHAEVKAVDWAEAVKMNGAHWGGLLWKRREGWTGWELTWCLMERRIRSIYQPALVRDRTASASAAHRGLPWINNGRSVGASPPLTTTEIGFSVTGLQGSVGWMMNCFYWADKAFLPLKKTTGVAFSFQFSNFGENVANLRRKLVDVPRCLTLLITKSVSNNPHEWDLKYSTPQKM